MGDGQSWAVRGLPEQDLLFESLGGIDLGDPSEVWSLEEQCGSSLGPWCPVQGGPAPGGAKQSGVRAAGWARKTCRKGGGYSETSVSLCGGPAQPQGVGRGEGWGQG